MLQGALQKDEELLWVGQPKPRLWTVHSTMICLCGVLPLTLAPVTLLSELKPWDETAKMLMGALLACTPFLLAAAAAPWIGLSWQRRFVYAITTRRALIIRYLIGKYDFRDFFDWEGQPKERRTHADGTVSLIMGTSKFSTTNGRPDPEGFLHLPPDAWQEPEQLLRRMAETAGANVTK